MEILVNVVGLLIILAVIYFRRKNKRELQEATAAQQSAKDGVAADQYKLATMYVKGQGVKQDYQEAVKWYRLAAEQGEVNAQSALGLMYDNGEGVSKDDREAIKWYRLAGEQGDANAQYTLGLKYASGEGIAQDDKEAVKWFHLSVDNGTFSAFQNLAEAYAEGKGVEKNLVEALKWYHLSAAVFDRRGSLGNWKKTMEGRTHVSEQMSPSQIEESQSLARDWQPASQREQGE